MLHFQTNKYAAKSYLQRVKILLAKNTANNSDIINLTQFIQFLYNMTESKMMDKICVICS